MYAVNTTTYYTMDSNYGIDMVNKLQIENATSNLPPDIPSICFLTALLH